jgi:hypothetical protein
MSTEKVWFYNFYQCCGAGVQCLFDPGSRIRCLFDPGSGIRNRFFPDPGSQIQIFDNFMTNFWIKVTIILSVLALKNSLPVQKYNYLQFYYTCGYKKW